MEHDERAMTATRIDGRSFVAALVGDGRPLLAFTGLSLGLSGVVALFLAATGHFLPQDEQFLGMTSAKLCSMHGCRIVHFMIHDRVSFGGALVAIGLVYLWLAEFPLKRGEPWAWWLFLVSGAEGFLSFFAYLGYGYLDTWHGLATLSLLPCFVAGLALSWRTLSPPAGVRTLFVPLTPVPWRSIPGLGRLCLMLTAAGLVGGGLTILGVGMTTVFVPQDLGFLGIEVAELRAINPRLVPLIAHDRAGFGGAVCCSGLLLAGLAWCARPTKSLWQALALSGSVGFAAAIGVHPVIGYNDALHLAPAVLGAFLFAAGMLAYRPACHGSPLSPTPAGSGAVPGLERSGGEVTTILAKGLVGLAAAVTGADRPRFDLNRSPGQKSEARLLDFVLITALPFSFLVLVGLVLLNDRRDQPWNVWIWFTLTFFYILVPLIFIRRGKALAGGCPRAKEPS